MTKFIVGVQIERTQVADLIVAVEAETVEEARQQVRKRLIGMAGTSLIEGSADKIEEWLDGFYSFDGFSNEDYSKGYAIDLDLTAETKP